MRRFLTFIFVGAVIAASWFIYTGERQEVEPERPEDINTVLVKPGAIDASVSATGNLEAERVQPLVFSATGKVVEVLVAEGDGVTAGQEVARLDSEDMALSLKQARAALKVSEASLARARKGSAEEDIAAAEAAIAAAKASLADLFRGPDQVDRDLVKLQLDQARNSLYGAQGNRDALGGNPFSSDAQMDIAEAQVLNAEVAVRMAEINLARLDDPPKASAVAGVRTQIAQAEASLARLLSMPSPEDIAVAEAQVAQARVGVEMAQSRLDDASLTVPFSGTLVSWSLHEGDTLAPGTPVGTLADVSQVHVMVQIDEIDIGEIAQGQKALITFDAFADQLVEGHVTEIEPLGTSMQGFVSYDVRIDLDPTELPIRPPMTAALDIVVAHKDDVLLIPNAALRRDREGKYVEVLRDNVSTRVYVRTGLDNEDYTEIISGLQEGDEVITGKPRESLLQSAGPFGGG